MCLQMLESGHPHMHDPKRTVKRLELQNIIVHWANLHVCVYEEQRGSTAATSLSLGKAEAKSKEISSHPINSST